MYAGSAVPNKPVIPVENFPELDKLRDNWETIRDEAVRLFDEGFIRAAAKNNDWGFYSKVMSGPRIFPYSHFASGLFPHLSQGRIDDLLAFLRLAFGKSNLSGISAALHERDSANIVPRAENNAARSKDRLQ
jgi:hypothetical protein